VGLIKTVGTVAVASAVHGRIQRRQQQRWAAQDLAAAQAAGYAAAPAAPQPAAPPMPADFVPAQAPAPGAVSQPGGSDRIDQLAKLGDLRQSGVLTEEEFQREKDRILKG
jgi:hypothetical protein